jgi:tetratricopeptide (TPR) repeat protein
VLLLIGWLRRERVGKEQLLEIVPYLGLGVGMGLLTVWWERYHQGTQGQLFTMGLLDRVLVAGRGIWFYLYKLAWPAKLTFSYPRWVISAADPLAYLWLLALCGLGWWAWQVRARAGRGPLAALAFFMVTLGPVLGFVMLYTFRYTFVADHYQYLACIGPIVLVAASIERAPLGQAAALRRPAEVVLLIVLGVLTWRQSATYKTEETLWLATLERNPASWLARNDLGDLYASQGRMADGLAEYQASLQITDADYEVHNNLGGALLHLGHPQEAIAEYENAIRLYPADGELHYNLGFALLGQGKRERAIDEFNQALQLNPKQEDARNSLGIALAQEGKPDEAIADFRQVLQADPDNAGAHGNLGMALLGEGKTPEAIAEFNEAIRIDPDGADAHYNLGNALLQTGQAGQAVAEYREALQSDPANTNVLGNLGVALLREGRAADAVAEFRLALQANPNLAQTHNDLGSALLESGDVAGAAAEFGKALQIDPHDLEAAENLAGALVREGRGEAALPIALQVNQATGGANPRVLRTLAAAQAQAGQFSNAVQTAQQALQLAQSRSDAAMANALAQDIKNYQAGHPSAESP